MIILGGPVMGLAQLGLEAPASGVGFSLALFVLGAVREIFGSGQLFGLLRAAMNRRERRGR